MKTIRLEVELPEDQAYALAELCKRLTFYDARNNAVSDDEAYLIMYAIDKVRSGLAEKDVKVR